MSHPLIVGLGSHCGDDGAGWIMVDHLRELGIPADTLKQAQHAAQILDVITPDRDLFVCDACEGPNPGTIHCWTWPTKAIVRLRCHGTHDMGLGDALELARQLDKCPGHVEIWAIEGCHWRPGTSISTPLVDAARTAAQAIWSRYVNA